VLAGVVFALGVGAGGARPAGNDQVTLSLLAYSAKPALDVLIPNFERVYPNITVSATYAGSATVYNQVVLTELETGSGPDLIATLPGCGLSTGVCNLAKAGYLAPLVNEPWVKRSFPSLLSVDKYGQGLYSLALDLAFQGLFTNDTMFKRLGLQVPRTFSELLSVCQKAKADGTIPILLPLQGSTVMQHLLTEFALSTVYAKDPHWLAELKAGTVTFDDTAGWHSALQRFIDMNNAGCFQPGPAGTGAVAADAQFAQGQALMLFQQTQHKGTIDAADPQFAYSQHPLPTGDDPSENVFQINVGGQLGINSHASPANQAAARTFIDFMSRPKQDALFAQIDGGVTQYQFLKGDLPPYLSSYASLTSDHRYALDPGYSWWNPAVLTALNTDGVGLVTGQESIDDVLNAMDAAWKQGPG
jgi:raffinose/stachyose/melibiose transport system substrate-binding protein